MFKFRQLNCLFFLYYNWIFSFNKFLFSLMLFWIVILLWWVRFFPEIGKNILHFIFYFFKFTWIHLFLALLEQLIITFLLLFALRIEFVDETFDKWKSYEFYNSNYFLTCWWKICCNIFQIIVILIECKNHLFIVIDIPNTSR